MGVEDAELAMAIELSLAEQSASVQANRAPDTHAAQRARVVPRADLVADFLDMFEQDGAQIDIASAALADAGGDVRVAAKRLFHGKQCDPEPEPELCPPTELAPEQPHAASKLSSNGRGADNLVIETRSTTAEAGNHFPPGCAVLVNGLKNAPQHNGKRGRILKFDEGKGRYQVELAKEAVETSGKPVRLLIKVANLSRVEIQEGIPPCVVSAVAGAAVAERHVEHDPALEVGELGSAPEPTGFDPSTSGEELPPGCAVLVNGLKNAPQHNGKRGRILKFDEGKGRYQVELAKEAVETSGKPVRLLIKVANLSRVEDPMAADDSSLDAGSASDDIEDIGCTQGFFENQSRPETG